MAVATAVMAWKTAGVAVATQADADASCRAAKATEDSAAAARATLDELRKGRELDWRPHLSIDIPSHKVASDGRVEFDYSVKNVGRGPALRCVCVFMDNRRAAFSGVFDVGSGDNMVGHGTNWNGVLDRFVGDIFGVDGQIPARNGWVIVCRDGVFGRWYRFRPSTVAPDSWTGEGEGPRWATAVQAVIPELAR